MTHGSLFSGIGGFDLAAHWAGIENIFACEIDEFCRKVLNKRFPNTTLFNDIKETNFEQYSGTIDIISGGFPCQPFSIAGKRTGTKDNRYLWGEMLRVVREIKPRWVIAENVRGLTNIAGGSTFETVCDDLEISGYEVQPFIIPALSVGAPHKRERVWIIAHATTDRRTKGKHECGNISEQIQKAPKRKFSGTVSLFDGNPPYSNSRGLERTEEERGQGEYALRSDSGVTRSITHPDSGKCLDIGRELQSPAETTSGKEQRQNRKRMWGESGTGVSKPTSITPDPESLRHGRRGNGHDCDDRERFICQDKQDYRNEIRGETTSRIIKTSYPDSERLDRSIGKESIDSTLPRGRQDWSEKWIEALTRIYGMDDGLPGGMDRLEQRYKDRSRKFRIKAMGNAIVPQIAHLIFKTILDIERL